MNTSLTDAARDLYLWQHGDDSFKCQLFGLIAKADNINREKLRRGFPTEVLVYQEWFDCPTEGEFYSRYGINRVAIMATDQI